MLLNREDILKASDLPNEDVNVPEWGGTVRVRAMTAGDRDAYDASIVDFSGDKPTLKKDNVRAKLLSRCIVDEEGKLLFAEKDIVLLGGKSVKAMERLLNVAKRLNGISEEVEESIRKK